MFYQVQHASNYNDIRSLFLSMWIFIVFVCLFSGVLNAQSNPVNLKEQTFSISIKTETQSEALVKLGQAIGYNFSYNTEIVEDIPVNMRFKNEKLSKILAGILGEQYREYEIIGHQIVILPGKFDNTNSRKKITGTLYDADNQEPVQFANIGIQNTGYGTVSNSEGEFALVIDSVNNNDTLVISALGYIKHHIPVRQIRSARQIIFLENKYIPIQEVIIRQSDPEKIVYNSIQHINQNYITTAIRLEAFYREYLLKNNELRNLYEASVSIFKPSYSSFYNDQIRVEKALSVVDSTKRDSVTVKLKGGLLNISSLDIAKTLPYYFNKETLHAFEYHIEDIVHNNDNEVYVIHFKPRDHYNVPPIQGRLYIEIKELVLIKAEIENKPSPSWKDAGIQVFKKTARLKTQLKQHSFNVQYSRINGQYYMKYFRSEINLKIKSRKSLFYSNYSLISELVTNQIDTTNITSFSYKERINPQTIFSEEIKDYPHEFWNNYNTLPPEKYLLREYFSK